MQFFCIIFLCYLDSFLSSAWDISSSVGWRRSGNACSDSSGGSNRSGSTSISSSTSSTSGGCSGAESLPHHRHHLTIATCATLRTGLNTHMMYSHCPQLHSPLSTDSVKNLDCARSSLLPERSNTSLRAVSLACFLVGAMYGSIVWCVVTLYPCGDLTHCVCDLCRWREHI